MQVSPQKATTRVELPGHGTLKVRVHLLDTDTDKDMARTNTPGKSFVCAHTWNV